MLHIISCHATSPLPIHHAFSLWQIRFFSYFFLWVNQISFQLASNYQSDENVVIYIWLGCFRTRCWFCKLLKKQQGGIYRGERISHYNQNKLTGDKSLALGWKFISVEIVNFKWKQLLFIQVVEVKQKKWCKLIMILGAQSEFHS